MTEQKLRAEIAAYSRRLHERGWVANHDGNISVRIGAGRFLCTPTATSKAEVTDGDILTVDEGGARVSGKGRPFSEMGLHLVVYRERADVQAVVHAHPVTATGFAVAGCALNVPMLAEAVVSIGPGIPLVPVAAPGPAAAEALRPFLAGHDVVLLGGNGVLAWGASVEQAYLRLELCEHLSRIALVARQLGGIQPLPAAMMPALLEARRKAGLGQAASATPQAPQTIEVAAPAPAGGARPGADLSALIREEIVAALKGPR